ncbi:hypothetical protein ACINWC743_A0223 [Acinetobacter sp. WC-743]|uniref:hypothetical protein n=1 Tax=Acinetobacter sp. WC-743 TaxID=903945 RepID=UPI0002AE9CBD|nr:hypothetical protein [Acinetobacter sp. WC-743]ELW78755.1 hypothetical protein ACINWC743_A0223 [Acinetobacter sp. WC-743]
MENKDVAVKSKPSKPAAKRLALRTRIFGSLEDVELWHRGTDDGYIHLPRILPLVVNIIDALTKGKPAGQTYLALWCRNYDEMIVDVTDEASLAYESGFYSERRVTTWQQRMQSLHDLGFVKAHKVGNRYQYVLMLHPIHAIKALYAEKKIQQEMYEIFEHRAYEVGALK